MEYALSLSHTRPPIKLPLIAFVTFKYFRVLFSLRHGVSVRDLILIVKNNDKYGDHHSWNLLLLYVRQSRVILENPYIKKIAKYVVRQEI